MVSLAVSFLRGASHAVSAKNGLSSKSLPIVLVALLLSAPSLATLKADNFVLIDHTGKAQELHYHRDAKAVVLIAHCGRGCRVGV